MPSNMKPGPADEWMDAIEVSDAPAGGVCANDHPMAAKLLAAGAAWDGRVDDFARGKGATCRDMAARLQRFGDFASDKQAAYAAKLVAWVGQPQRVQHAGLNFPRVYEIMGKLAGLHLPGVKLSRKRDTGLVWVLDRRETVAGKMESPQYVPFPTRVGQHGQKAIVAALRAAEADPMAAAVKYGRESGRCAVCGQELTDPESIARGIGPICAERMS